MVVFLSSFLCLFGLYCLEIINAVCQIIRSDMTNRGPAHDEKPNYPLRP